MAPSLFLLPQKVHHIDLHGLHHIFARESLCEMQSVSSRLMQKVVQILHHGVDHIILTVDSAAKASLTIDSVAKASPSCLQQDLPV